MRIFAALKKEFSFLQKEYGFRIINRARFHTGYYITWTNFMKIIVAELYEPELRITVYDYGYYFVSEHSFPSSDYETKEGQNWRLQIQHAAEWLKTAIAEKVIMI